VTGLYSTGLAPFPRLSAPPHSSQLVYPVFSHIRAISFTRDELLDIRKYTPPDISPVFIYSDVLLDIVISGAAVLFRRYRTRKRGKRAGALMKLRRGLRMPLPSIHLASLCSLPNKTDKLHLFSRLNKDFSNSAALCFTETWLNDAIPDSALHLRISSLSEQIAMQNQLGNHKAVGRAFTSMRGVVQM